LPSTAFFPCHILVIDLLFLFLLFGIFTHYLVVVVVVVGI
jgi:hypothetical protein